LSREGAIVVGTGRNVDALKELQVTGAIRYTIVADITQPGACQMIVDDAVKLLDSSSSSSGGGGGGGLDAVVNAAGVLQGGAMGSVDMTNYHYNVITNTQAPFEIMMHAIPHLKQQPSSSIVNVSSVNGKQLDQLTRCASVDLAKDGIRVNAVNPGVIETNLQKTGGLSEEQYDAFLKRSIELTHPLSAHLGRVGQPEEVGELIAFLVSDKAKFITGECIAIDGGRQNLGAR
jgi:NAD(P)-dependent dehydrogenase (short-subunit alcohol dehydrogenase family)